jgi:ferritin-like metal-binding protein YciE
MKLNTLEDVFVHELRDVYHAEKQLVKALPKMAKAASSPELRSAFEDHLEQTKGHVERLEAIFGQMKQKAKTEKCAAMKGLVAEGEEIIEANGEPQAKDAGLIAKAQKVEHYEIASYGTLISWAQQLGQNEAVELLRLTLTEEKDADQKLTQLAESALNTAAAAHAHA